MTDSTSPAGRDEAASDGEARQERVRRAKVTLGLFLGPLAALGLLLMEAPADMPPAAWQVVALTAWMATWWVLEPVPIAVTALLPVAVLPLLGVGTISEVAVPYANPLIFLFLGGFLLAEAIQRWGLHRRIAMLVLRVSGSRPDRLVGGFMIATAALSMWVSNTATAALMVPIGLSVLAMLERQGGSGASRHTALTLLLGIALAANIGGMGTLIGTPPNALLAGYLAERQGIEIGFGRWMLLALPVVLVMMVLAWLVLTRAIYRVRDAQLAGAGVLIGREQARLGPLSAAERRFAVVFVLTALAWLGRPGLQGFFPELGLTDAGIAMTAALALFIIPADSTRRRCLIDWEGARGIPWNVLVLIGGGLSLGTAIETSGLAGWAGAALPGLAAWPLPVLIAAIVAVALLASHVTSNTATAATLVPLLAALAISLGEDPLILAVPAVLAASCAFMLPVATPPNAIVHGTGLISVAQMARAGAVLSIAAVGVVVAATLLLAGPVLG
jgi:solute carrier family 13 (sodium-dependent dicarboxylate transporter), member 2/3/5